MTISPSSRRLLFVVLHLCGWLAYFFSTLLPFFMLQGVTPPGPFRPPGAPALFPPPPHIINLSDVALVQVAHTLVLASFFYLQLLVFLPRYLQRNKLTTYVLATIGAMVVHWALDSAVIQASLIARINPNAAALIKTGFVVNLLMATALAVAIRFTISWFQDQRTKAEIETAQLAAELTLLKYQLSPHFLFNTLNNLRTLIRRQSPSAEPMVLGLSEILRYMVYDAETEFIELDKELDYIEHFLALQRLRLPEGAQVQFTRPDDATGGRIAPMLLFPLVENAFKHDNSVRNQLQIKLQVRKKSDRLEFYIQNAYNANSQKAESGGLGLRNLRRRLDLIYSENYLLETKSTDSQFFAFIDIPLR